MPPTSSAALQGLQRCMSDAVIDRAPKPVARTLRLLALRCSTAAMRDTNTAAYLRHRAAMLVG